MPTDLQTKRGGRAWQGEAMVADRSVGTRSGKNSTEGRRTGILFGRRKRTKYFGNSTPTTLPSENASVDAHAERFTPEHILARLWQIDLLQLFTDALLRSMDIAEIAVEE
jgi:hypothetical protein